MEMAKHLPTNRNEGIPYFALLVHRAFVSPIKLSLSQPTNFLTLTLPMLSPTPPAGSERVAVWCLAAY